MAAYGLSRFKFAGQRLGDDVPDHDPMFPLVLLCIPISSFIRLGSTIP